MFEGASCMISGFCCHIDESCVLLDYYLLPLKMGWQVVLKRWQGITTTHCIIVHKCAVLKLQAFEENLDCLVLKMKLHCFFKVSVTIYQSKWHKIPENLSVCQRLKWVPWIFQCEVCLKFSQCLFLFVHTEIWVFGCLTFFYTAINKMCMIDWLIFPGMFWDSTCQTQSLGVSSPLCAFTSITNNIRYTSQTQQIY